MIPLGLGRLKEEAIIESSDELVSLTSKALICRNDSTVHCNNSKPATRIEPAFSALGS
jgi:hypothetical protein